KGRLYDLKYPLVFDGVYNNARMLHFLTAVVGSTCDIRVKNGSVYEGIFKTLSSRCELAVDAVHRRCEESGGDISSGPPRREEITDTMVFSPSDLVTMTCRDVDLNFATRDSFTDSAISSSRVNGEHREKVLQRWDGGDSNGDSYELEADASNGWDANEMFRYNEENYGIKSTYDSSLSMYTMPLEKGNSEGYRQREARATRIANEIESSPQYRHRLALENEDGKTEEEKYSAVVHERDSGERERGQESPNTSNSREGKYVPIPQRVRDMGISASSMRTDRERERASGGGHPPVPSRVGGPHTSRPTIPNSTSKHTPPSPGCQPAAPSERNSPHQRGGASAASPFASTSQSRSTEAPIAPATSPPASHPLVNPEPRLTIGIGLSKLCSFVNSYLRAGLELTGVYLCVSQVKRSTLNPNAKEFNPSKVLMSLFKPTSAPTPPRHTPNSPSVLLQTQPGQGAIYSSPYLSYMSPIQIQSHSVQAPQVYHYMSTVSQGKYPRAKGSVVTPRPEHSSSAPPMLQAGPSLVASPYPQSYLQYGPQQYGQQVLPAMGHYPGQPMYSMLQSGTRMLGSGGHAQALGPAGPPYPGQSEGPPAPQPALYGTLHSPQSFSHHPPQPSSTPTGSQPPQHTGPAPGQSAQAGPQAQSLYGPLSAPTPPNMPPGHTSPQGSYPLQGYSLHGPQPIHHTYPSLGHPAGPQLWPPTSAARPTPTAGSPPSLRLYRTPLRYDALLLGSCCCQVVAGEDENGGIGSFCVPFLAVQVQAHAPQQLPFHPPGN
uniref:Ataxin 2-like n=1 Tax=Scleropages formosus TaxID=113540 RepID=A0A8C9UX08_SCLFO